MQPFFSNLIAFGGEYLGLILSQMQQRTRDKLYVTNYRTIHVLQHICLKKRKHCDHFMICLNRAQIVSWFAQN